MDKYKVGDLQREYIAVFEKVEQLRKLGLKKLVYTTRNLAELRLQIESIRDYESLERFKMNGYLEHLKSLTRACGEVCCRFLVEPGSPMQFFACSSCPIEKFEMAIEN